MKQWILITTLALLSISAWSRPHHLKHEPASIITAAERTDLYLPLLRDKKIAIVANHTSLIGNTHLLDSLISGGINVQKVFSPEHGFRGTADAGALVENGVDIQTGIPVVSLYGNHKKPTAEDLKSIELVVFDLQDVGVRFYTYISTLTYVMEACGEQNIPVVVLDRPNPNGHYIDGPLLDTAFSSFVGLHPVPVVYGMTIGEYAQMVNGEGWMKNGLQCELEVIPLKNYDHHTYYQLPVKPSPNLPNMNSVYLYPSLCFFEGTMMSVGRGTDNPFQIFGHPDFAIGSYVFIPEPKPGASMHPKHLGKKCYGISLIHHTLHAGVPQQLKLDWLMSAWDYFKNRDDFFISYFDKLAGTDQLRKQIISGMTEEEIRQSWQADLNQFKKTREKYLMY